MPERARKDMGGKGPVTGVAVRAAQNGCRLDSEIISKMEQDLGKSRQIPASRIKTECAIRIYREDPMDKYRVHAPDIAVVDGEGGVWFIIEQDGRVHESGKLARKDGGYNRHYAVAGIPCTVLGTRAIRTGDTSMDAAVGGRWKAIYIPARYPQMT